jgi:integrase
MKEVQPIRNADQIEAMKDELLKTGYRDYLLFTMGINTGLRVSDLLTLKVGDVRGKDVYTLREQKTGKTKRIDLHAVKNQIERFTATEDEADYLFKSRKGDNCPITRVQAYRILNAAAQRVGLEEIGTHTMRKTFGYHFYRKYKDVAVLQTLFNHSAPSITLRYIGITQDGIEAMTKDFSL